MFHSFVREGVHTYTTEDFGGQVFIKLANDYSYVVVLKVEGEKRATAVTEMNRSGRIQLVQDGVTRVRGS